MFSSPLLNEIYKFVSTGHGKRIFEYWRIAAKQHQTIQLKGK